MYPYADETGANAGGTMAFSGQQQAKLRERISSLFFLSVNKGDIALNIHHIRRQIIQENAGIQAEFEADDACLLPLFSRAVGRLSQGMEYLSAAERVPGTKESGDTPLYNNFETIKQILRMVQGTSIRFMSGPGGAMPLSRMDGNSPFDLEWDGGLDWGAAR